MRHVSASRYKRVLITKRTIDQFIYSTIHLIYSALHSLVLHVDRTKRTKKLESLMVVFLLQKHVQSLLVVTYDQCESEIKVKCKKSSRNDRSSTTILYIPSAVDVTMGVVVVAVVVVVTVVTVTVVTKPFESSSKCSDLSSRTTVKLSFLCLSGGKASISSIVSTLVAILIVNTAKIISPMARRMYNNDPNSSLRRPWSIIRVYFL